MWTCILGFALLFVANWCYQVIRKPAELLVLFPSSSPMSYRSTWQHYGSIFQAHSTEIVSPQLLAALAQVETQGNPLARTYWRWNWSLNPFKVFTPASSAVGILQITDGTFEEAKRYCIHDHKVVKDGPWYDLKSCWFNSLYSRPIASHSVEMTAARLHHIVTETLQAHRLSGVTLEQKQDLATVVHLCGTQRGGTFLRRRFRVAAGERCGGHDLGQYLARVQLLTRQFARLEPPP